MAKIMLNGVDYSAPTSGEEFNGEVKELKVAKVSSPLIPSNSNTYDVGAELNKWNNVYAKTVHGAIDTQEITNENNPGISINKMLSIAGNTSPRTDNTYTLGESSGRWKQLYANTSTISTSDRNLKDNIEDLKLNDKWLEFFMMLQPKSYIFKNGNSGRTHVGFVAQDVEYAMEKCGLSSFDFAGFCKDQKMERVTEIQEIPHSANEETGREAWVEEKKFEVEKPVFDDDGKPVYIYSLRYEEFIALNTMIIQKQQNKINDLESRISIIESMI